MEFKEVITGRDTNIIVRPGKHVGHVRVPEGGAGWVFIVAAAVTIAWAAIKRYSVWHSSKLTADVS